MSFRLLCISYSYVCIHVVTRQVKHPQGEVQKTFTGACVRTWAHDAAAHCLTQGGATASALSILFNMVLLLLIAQLLLS